MYNIVFAGDDKYIKYIAVAITSIVNSTDKGKKIIDFQESINKEVHGENFISSENLENTEEGYHFHILTDFIAEDTKAKLKGLEEELSKVFPVKIENYVVSDKEFRGFQKWANSYLTFYRFKLYEILPKNVKKALYLDGDMLICSDIRELFAVDLKDEKFMAVPELDLRESLFEKLKFSANPQPKELLELLGKEELPQKLVFKGKYFNAGLLLIDLDNWRANKVSEKAMGFLQNYHATFLDQDALNFIVETFISLPKAWNVEYINTKNTYKRLFKNKNFEHDSQEVYDAIMQSDDFKNIHYNTRKPWSSLGVMRYGAEIDFTFVSFINLWWIEALKTPCFKEDLLAIKKSKTYLRKVNKEKMLLNICKKPFLFKIYLQCSAWNGKIKYLTGKVEKPIKQLRNKIRGKLAQ